MSGDKLLLIRKKILLGKIIVILIVSSYTIGCSNGKSSKDNIKRKPSINQILRSYPIIKKTFKVINSDRNIRNKIIGLETIAHIIVINKMKNPKGKKKEMMVPGPPNENIVVPGLNKREIEVILDEIVKLLKFPERNVRHAAVKVLVYSEEFSLLPIKNALESGVLGKVFDREKLIQEYYGANGASYALIKIGKKSKGIATLLLTSKNRVARISGTLFFLLSNLDKKEVPINYILPLLKDKEIFIRRNAVEIIGKSRIIDHAFKLVPLLSDGSDDVRKAARSALYELCGFNSIALEMAELDSTQNKKERKKALDTLKEKIKKIRDWRIQVKTNN